MKVYTEEEHQQAEEVCTNQPKPKPGVVIAVSDALPSGFFRGPRRGRTFPVQTADEAWARRVARAVRS